jgi:hypothetical protein
VQSAVESPTAAIGLPETASSQKSASSLSVAALAARDAALLLETPIRVAGTLVTGTILGVLSDTNDLVLLSGLVGPVDPTTTGSTALAGVLRILGLF